jgi:hypothetical protein
MRHKHAVEIIAWANGAEIQYYDAIMCRWSDYKNPTWYEEIKFRIKPEPKPDFVRNFEISKDGSVLLNSDSMNIKLTFDGETGKLKSSEVLK